jgi:YVTN family beta-propeller protein
MRYVYALVKTLVCVCIASSAAADISSVAPVQLTTIKVFAAAAGDARFDYAAIDAASRRLYVARGFGVTAIDLDTDQVTRQLVAGQHVHAVVPLPGGRVLSTNGDSDTATIFDGKSGAVLAKVGTGKSPDGAAFDPASGLVLVMNGKSGDITLVNPDSGKSVGRIDVGGALGFPVADGRGHVYVNVEDQNRMAVIDTDARRVSGYYALPECEGPTALGLDPLSGVLVAACANRNAIALRAADGKIMKGHLPIDRKPDAVIFDATKSRFYIPCGRDGTLAVIAAGGDGSLAVVATIPTAVGAHTGAFDAQTGRLYIPVADYHLTLTGFAPADDSFRILVIGPSG